MRDLEVILQRMWGKDDVPEDLKEFCERVQQNIDASKVDTDGALRSTQVIGLIVELYRTGLCLDLLNKHFFEEKP